MTAQVQPLADDKAVLDQLIDDLVTANHILLHHGIVDSFGHVSARHPFLPDRFLMARRIAPGLVRREHIREWGMDGELIDADGTPGFLERYIHSAIFASRPDAGAVIHSHSPGIVSFGVVKDQPLRALCHTGAFLGEGAPVFEMRDVAGPDTNLMITDQKLGECLASSMGDSKVVLMRGHGSTVVGSNVQDAVFTAIYSEVAAGIQSAAMALGEVNYLSPGEISTINGAGSAGSAIVVERTWDFWKSELG